MSDEAGIAVPLVSPKPARFRTLIIPAISILAMILSLGLMFGLVSTNSADIKRNCETNRQFYNTFEKVIYAAGHPPILAGHKPSPLQAAALRDYANNLRSGLPTKPTC